MRQTINETNLMTSDKYRRKLNVHAFGSAFGKCLIFGLKCVLCLLNHRPANTHFTLIDIEKSVFDTKFIILDFQPAIRQKKHYNKT